MRNFTKNGKSQNVGRYSSAGKGRLQVVQRREGVRVYSTSRRDGCVRPLLGDSGKWIQESERRTGSGVYLRQRKEGATSGRRTKRLVDVARNAETWSGEVGVYWAYLYGGSTVWTPEPPEPNFKAKYIVIDPETNFVYSLAVPKDTPEEMVPDKQVAEIGKWMMNYGAQQAAQAYRNQLGKAAQEIKDLQYIVSRLQEKIDRMNLQWITPEQDVTKHPTRKIRRA